MARMDPEESLGTLEDRDEICRVVQEDALLIVLAESDLYFSKIHFNKW